ncbi:hypothetical protein NQF86_00280 [Bombella sp. TMW 2.2543]|uniref:Baseplate protein J-like domain-containing protein n=1 Tax=Bombella pluederhausensis TaxID=2967336 RepID=A0ABT3WDE5_9PROT|nr:baseplate J/gp47 family protein [Bombella pluederhausensis]MCX5617109.1 hypothetical protein [Bombella pluederhausensis]
MPSSDATTNVPAPSLTDAGFIAPSEQDILAGVLADMNAALGGGANTALSTPQGQIALSETAILGDFLGAMISVFNGVDPASSSGRMQEAIGRIYFIERRPATATTVTVQASVNAPGQTITAGTVVAQGSDGSLYVAPQAITLPQSSTASFDLACQAAGAITCPANSLTLYQAGLGLASLSNTAPGATGADAEDRADFEARRQASVAANSIGQNASLMGALLGLPGVTDAFVTDNPSQTDNVQQGVTIPAGAQYILVEGGSPEDIGQAILHKKPPGIPTVGTQIVTVQDTNPVYAGNQPSYSFHYDRPTPVAVYVVMEIAASDAVPSNAAQLIQQAIVSYLTTGANRIRLGKTVYASRLSAVVDGLGDWAEVLTLTIGTDRNAGQNRLTLPINQLPTVTADTISVQVVA